MKSIAAIAISVFCAATLFAADTPAREDSPIVRAAKIAAAKRQQLAAQGQIIIDDAHLKSSTGHITISGGGAPLPPISPVPRTQPAAPKVVVVQPTLSPAERTKLEKKIEDLKHERVMMTDEADQPYSGEGREDQVAKRLTQIQKELADAERKLASSSQPSKPPQ